MSRDRWQEPLFDRLTHLDEIAENDIVPLLEGIYSRLGGESRAYTLDLSSDVQADVVPPEEQTETREIPFDGWITSFVVGWPDGAGHGVAVQLRFNEGQRLFPRDSDTEYTSANDFTHRFPLRTPVRAGEDITAGYINTHEAYSFPMTALVTVEEAVE